MITVKPQESDPKPGEKLRVLLVDDDDLTRDLLRRSLKILPLEIDDAEDGMTALKLCLEAEAAGRPYRLVVLDLNMPQGWNGEEIIMKLKEIKNPPSVLLCTGAHEDPLLNYADSYGFDDVLKKPFTPSQARKLISEHLGFSDT